MRRRGFSLVELMVVVAVIGIGGALAGFAMSEQISAARARSDELGLYMRLKTERNNARERLRPLAITNGTGGSIRFHRVTTIAGTTCDLGPVITTAVFKDAKIVPGGQLCLDENGRAVGDFDLVIEASDGNTSSLKVTSTGVMETSLTVAKDVAVEQLQTEAPLEI